MFRTAKHPSRFYEGFILLGTQDMKNEHAGIIEKRRDGSRSI
jgi:hypothetical protein